MRIDAIVVGVRRREVYGDITALARSIKHYGLIHPVVVDDAGRLVAGGRRLAACQQLGWTEIPVTRLSDLTETQRREIELEENLQRLDLTPYERSLTVAQLCKAAREAAAEEEQEFRGDSPRNSKRGRANEGRPPTKGSGRDLARRTGIPERTLRDAEAHVALAQRYPMLQQPQWKQSAVMALAETFEPLSEQERDRTMELLDGTTNSTKTILEVAGNIARMKPKERAEVWRLAASDDSRDRSRALTLAARKPPMPDPRETLVGEALRYLRLCIKDFPDDPLVPALQTEVDHLTKLREAIKRHEQSRHAQ